MVNAALAALGAHHLGKRAHCRFINVRDAESGRIQLVARAHGANDGRADLFGVFDERQLAGHGVDGVDDIVISREIEPIGGLGKIERLKDLHGTGGVDGKHALARHLHL